LLRETVIEHEVMSLSGYWTLHQTYVGRYVVIDPSDSGTGTFSITTEKDEELTNVELIVVPPEGEPRKYGRDVLIRQEKAGGKASYKFAYPSVTRGTIVEERTELNYGDQRKEPTLRHRSRLRTRWPCQRVRVVYAYPKEWGVQVKRIAEGKALDYRVHDRGGKRHIVYEQTDVPPLPLEPYAPYFYEDGLQFRVAATLIRLSNWAYYAPIDWKAFAKQFRKYVVENDAVFSTRVSATARQVVRGLPDAEQRFRAIVGYVQRTIRADEDYEEKDFADVLKTGRGSPWQTVGLTYRMLRKAGLDTEFVLIHPATNGYFDPTFVHRGELDEAAVASRIGGRLFLALPQRKYLPVGLIPPALQGRPALRITDEGFAGFFTAPTHDATANRIQRRFDIRVSPGGSLDVHSEVTSHGLRAYGTRREIGQMKPDELKKWMKETLKYADGEAKLTSSEVLNLEDTEKPLVLRRAYTIDNLLTLAGNEAVLQTSGLLAARMRATRRGQLEDRVRPIHIHGDREVVQEVELRLPPGWSLQTKLANAETSNQFGEASVVYDTAVPGLLRVRSRLFLRRIERPRGEFKALTRLLDRGEKLDVPSLVFRTGGSPSATRIR
jgi:hypothetical protein